ncbi:beta-ketoacyl synthase N-terminal-like domain-containing protein [Nonomuraea jabiensis]|uniref:beta-ketoacyl synthase N-terminal-like domain-containing protein n=1 Tax=Nonomuraea jabiensis TaxID=882448 RepID=UPI003418DC80
MSGDIVGMGVVTCLGDEPEAVHRALCDGRTGVAPLRAFDSALFRVKHAYEIDDRTVPGQDEPGRASRWLRAAVAAALADAGLPATVPDVPVIVGTTLRELRSAELWWRDGHSLTPAELHFGQVMRDAFGTTETHTVASACAAALYALGMATDLIALGLADTVVVAGTDAITESSFGGLDRVQNPPPQAIQPFARHRRGMVMGEGAAAVVVRASGNHPRPAHACVRGVAMNCDAAHATVPDVAGVAGAVRDAHRRAGVDAADIDLVVVHGSGTRHNDAVEAGVLRDVFRGVRPGPLVTSVKSGLGHTCGGSGLMSLIIAVLAMRTGELPPIPGLSEPSPEAGDLRLVAGHPARGRFDTAQINAIGLGGINAVAVIGGAA